MIYNNWESLKNIELIVKLFYKIVFNNLNIWHLVLFNLKIIWVNVQSITNKINRIESDKLDILRVSLNVGAMKIWLALYILMAIL